MTRAMFLADRDVRDFISWLQSRMWAGHRWSHRYIDRDSGVERVFTSVLNASEQYVWMNAKWPNTKRELDNFRRLLRAAVAAGDSQGAFDACRRVLKWGGVLANNGRCLDARRETLLRELEHVSAILKSDVEPTEAQMRLDAEDPTTLCQLNAGFVKIYSALLDHCVIYDGRVGAALGLFVRQFCETYDYPSVPAPLAFAWGAPKEAANAAHPKQRNPSTERYRFPRLAPSPHRHAGHTMRANWLLQAAHENDSPFTRGEDGFHELAAGLFMIGYDLPAPGVATRLDSRA